MPTWIRVRDLSTGHEYDLMPRQVEAAGAAIEVIDGYVPHRGQDPRPAKHRVDKAGNPQAHASRARRAQQPQHTGPATPPAEQNQEATE